MNLVTTLLALIAAAVTAQDATTATSPPVLPIVTPPSSISELPLGLTEEKKLSLFRVFQEVKNSMLESQLAVKNLLDDLLPESTTTPTAPSQQRRKLQATTTPPDSSTVTYVLQSNTDLPGNDLYCIFGKLV